jgi:NADH-quinone oxidoreductase subunit L
MKSQGIYPSLGALYNSAYLLYRGYIFITKGLVQCYCPPAAWFDKNIIDGMVNMAGDSTVWISGKIKGIQWVGAAICFVLYGRTVLLLVYVWK